MSMLAEVSTSKLAKQGAIALAQVQYTRQIAKLKLQSMTTEQRACHITLLLSALVGLLIPILTAL